MASTTHGPPPFPTSLSGSGLRLRRPFSIPHLSLTVSDARSRSKSEVSVSSSLSPPLLTKWLAPPNPSLPPLTGSTGTIATLLANARSSLPKSLIFAAIFLPPGVFSPPNPTSLFLRSFSKRATVSFPLLPPKCKLATSYSPNPPPIPARNRTHSQLIGSTSAWSLFFAVVSPQIFGCVLLIRVLLGWFPNFQWDNPLMSAIGDLCDSYLSLSRGIIPPLFNSMDVSPIWAFLLLGMLVQLARPPRLY